MAGQDDKVIRIFDIKKDSGQELIMKFEDNY